jgi:hypothetical protein
MMFSEKLNLLGLRRSTIVTIEKEECIVIPIKSNNIWRNKRNTVAYINLIVKELINGKDIKGHTHYIMQDNKDILTMTAEEVKAMPVIGNMRPLIDAFGEITEDKELINPTYPFPL